MTKLRNVLLVVRVATALVVRGDPETAIIEIAILKKEVEKSDIATSRKQNKAGEKSRALTFK